MKRISSIISSLILLAMLATNVMAAPAADSSTATFKVIDVIPNSYVTIQTFGFPLNTDIQVYMTPFPSLGISSALVAGFNTGSNESGTYRFEIAASVRGFARVSMRLVDSDFSLTRVFNNVAGGTSTGTTTTTTTTPTISIVSVVKDSTVTIRTHNFPSSRTFNVLMGTVGSLGVGGTNVGSFDSGSGASNQYTFDIPDSLKGDARIDIRAESTTGGFFAFNRFTNNTGATSTTPSTPAAIPTIHIDSVVRDSKVTISTSNWPANDSFEVFMGLFGTLGIGGVKVDTVSSGSGGSMTFTFTIPDSLKGQSRIAIRTVSPTSGFFSFNWFWNNTFP